MLLNWDEQTLKSHLPDPAAVDQALKIWEQEVRDAAGSSQRQAGQSQQVDHLGTLHSKRINQLKKPAPYSSSFPLSFQLSSLKASWLTSKKNRGINGILAALPTPDDMSAVLAHSDVLKQCFQLVRGLTPDRPIEEWRKDPRKKHRWPFLLGKQPPSYTSDPKLTQKPVFTSRGPLLTQKTSPRLASDPSLTHRL